MAGVSGHQPGGMRRHMELHARGLEGQGIEASTFFVESGLGRTVRGLQSRLPGALLLGGLLGRMRRERPDIVNVHSSAAPAWIAARLLGLHRANVVVMSYAADERALPEGRTLRGAVRWTRVAAPARLLIPRAAGVWCVNSEDAEFYRSKYGLPAGRVVVIPHAIEESFYQDPGVQREWNQLLFVGTWIRRKGADVLTRAIPPVLSRHAEYRVVLAGTMSDPAEVRRGIPDGLLGRVTIYPCLDDARLRRLYWGSGLLLVPSRLEGLPFSLLEGMAGGCPALASANSGMRDTIEDGRNGWLLESSDPGEWERRTEEVMRDVAGRRKASGAAQGTAARFRLDALTRRVVAWYEGLQ